MVSKKSDVMRTSHNCTPCTEIQSDISHPASPISNSNNELVYPHSLHCGEHSTIHTLKTTHATGGASAIVRPQSLSSLTHTWVLLQRKCTNLTMGTTCGTMTLPMECTDKGNKQQMRVGGMGHQGLARASIRPRQRQESSNRQWTNAQPQQNHIRGTASAR